jgi:hypothetical protein
VTIWVVDARWKASAETGRSMVAPISRLQSSIELGSIVEQVKPSSSS